MRIKDDTLTINYNNTKYDTLTHIATIHWGSLANGEYCFETISAFQQKRKTFIILRNDTTVYISSSYKYNFVDSISKEELLKADTIAFAFQAQGCTFSIQGYSLMRNGNKYELKGSIRNWKRIEKDVLPEIINDLFEIQIFCKKFPLHDGWC